MKRRLPPRGVGERGGRQQARVGGAAGRVVGGRVDEPRRRGARRHAVRGARLEAPLVLGADDAQFYTGRPLYHPDAEEAGRA